MRYSRKGQITRLSVHLRAINTADAAGDALTSKAAADLIREIGGFSPKLEKVLAFLLAETKEVREGAKRDNEALRAEAEKRSKELDDKLRAETDALKGIIKASSTLDFAQPPRNTNRPESPPRAAAVCAAEIRLPNSKATRILPLSDEGFAPDSNYFIVHISRAEGEGGPRPRAARARRLREERERREEEGDQGHPGRSAAGGGGEELGGRGAAGKDGEGEEGATGEG